MTDTCNGGSERLEQEILELIDWDTGYTVKQFSNKLDVNEREIQNTLANLMDSGKITSTPDWKYRESRNTLHTENEYDG